MGDQTEVRFYGLGSCPDCRILKATLAKLGRPFEYLDLAEVGNLRDFLLLRDADPSFEKPRAEKRVGIPCLLRADGSACHDWRGELGIDPADEVSEEEADALYAAEKSGSAPAGAAGAACTIGGDHSGC